MLLVCGGSSVNFLAWCKDHLILLNKGNCSELWVSICVLGKCMFFQKEIQINNNKKSWEQHCYKWWTLLKPQMPKTCSLQISLLPLGRFLIPSSAPTSPVCALMGNCAPCVLTRPQADWLMVGALRVLSFLPSQHLTQCQHIYIITWG